MADEDAPRLYLRVVPGHDSDSAELAGLADELQAELLGLDIPSVEPLAADEVPASAKGAAPVFGWLVAQFGTLAGLKAVVAAVTSWAGLAGHSVEISLDGETLKVSRATADQQRELIDAWLSRHAPRT
jgi:hypothetical protein